MCLLREHAIRYCQEEGRTDVPEKYLAGRVRKGLWERLQREQRPRLFVGRRDSVGTIDDPPPNDDGDDKGTRGDIAAAGERPLEVLCRRETREAIFDRLDDEDVSWKDVAVIIFSRLGWGPSRIAETM